MARKILLADDSVTAQNMGRKILTDAGYEVVTVNNGSAALKKILELKPDLIVLDVYMPGYSGLEVCQRIKENKETSRIPILLTVGKLEPFKPEEARRAKADAFVVKPFEASELLAALARLEDKVVPQPEPYKQGRFAKAVAAVDPQTASLDKDESWKGRIRMPGPAKGPGAEVAEEKAAAQNTPFRDFNGDTAKKKNGAGEQTPAGTFERPMPAGLPADITPEEIAAITAAAEQLRSAAATAPKSDTIPDEVAGPPAEVAAEAAPVTFASAPEAENSSSMIPERATEAQSPAPDDRTVPETSAMETRSTADEAVPSVVPAAEIQIAGAVESAAFVAASQESPSQPASPSAGQQPSSVADDEVMAALQSLMPAGEGHTPSAGTNGAGSNHGGTGAISDALGAVDAASLQAHAAGPRWIAEEVALAPDEMTLSLAAEMEQAYAAVAASESLRATVAAAPAEPDATVAAVAVVEAPVSQNGVTADLPAPAVYAMAAAAGDPAMSASTAPAREADVAQTQPLVESEVQAVAEPPAAVQFSVVSAEGIVEAPPIPDAQDAPAGAKLEIAGGDEDMVANWKNIRDSIVSGAAKPAPALEKEEVRVADPPSKEAEKPADIPETRAQSASDPKAIASIVDSVLAELRPKIVEEIAKKLADKKD